MMNSRRVYFWLLVFAVMFGQASVGETAGRPASVSGKWQISWEARLGTAHGTVQLEQAESKLAGSYQGELGTPKVSGTVEGKNVSFTLDFQGAHPFSLIFKGVVDGDKMAGKFEVGGVEGGYDQHGENARPSNYTWIAVRQPDASSARN
jgi:autotransporter translocation and assembly factor TamB